jgi:hypothetical protein
VAYKRRLENFARIHNAVWIYRLFKTSHQVQFQGAFVSDHVFFSIACSMFGAERAVQGVHYIMHHFFTSDHRATKDSAVTF